MLKKYITFARKYTLKGLGKSTFINTKSMSMKKITLLFSCLLISIGLITAQTVRVTGMVISEDDGEPVMGASIVAKGNTSIGTITDIDGNFSISVPDNVTTLVVSYVGMTPQEVAVSTQRLTITLSSSIELSEVVITAMGISREKKALGYAVQDVKGEDLIKGASTNIASALQGKVSGVQITSASGMPGSSARFVIRGTRSFTGDNTPLYVVDGMPIASAADRGTGQSTSGSDYSNRSIDIDPNDIESINILKGQAASALYGMRASNGVVVITTKSGKNAKSDKPQITLVSNVTFDKPSTYFDYQNTYAQGSGGRYVPTASTSWGPKITELADDPTYGGNTDNAYTQSSGKKPGQYYVTQRARAGLDPWATPQAYDNVKDFFETGVSFNNNVNIAQSFDKGHYSFSLGNTSQNGIIPSTGMDRYNARMSGEAKLHDHWTTGFSGNFSTSKINKQTSANNGIVATLYGAPPSYDLAGIPPHYEGNPYSQNTFRVTSGFDGPYWAVEHNKWIERNNRFFGNTYLNYNTKLNTEDHKLNVKYQIGVDSYTTNMSDMWGYGHANGRGEINEYNYIVTEANSLLTANYSWDINDDLLLNVLVGTEFMQRKRKYNRVQAQNFNFPGWNHIDNASNYASYEDFSRRRTVGNFYDVSLSYANMLYLTTTGRADAVSYMPRNNRSYFYPSVALGFIFTELDAVKNEILTYGKLRASYAVVGQGETYYDTFFATPTYSGGFYSGNPLLYPINGVTGFGQYGIVYDPNLKPQYTRSYEIGADLTFFKGLFSINYTYSNQDTKDQIFEVPLPRSTGSSDLVTNGGRVVTNAHEVTLSANPIDTKDFKWNLAFNFTKINNIVKELADGVDNIYLGGFTDPQVRYSVGDKMPVIFGTQYLRNDAGEVVVDEDGLPQYGPEGVIGVGAPDFLLGFNTSFEIYKVRIGATFDWKSGGQMYGGTINVADYYGTTRKTAEYREKDFFYFEHPAVKATAWDADGNPTAFAPNDIKIPGSMAFDYFDTMNGISEGGIVNSGFIKLRELSLGYPIWNKRNLRVDLNLYARNIIIWNEVKGGIDPEIAQGNNNMGGGVFERFSLPGVSSYGFGLNVKF